MIDLAIDLILSGAVVVARPYLNPKSLSMSVSFTVSSGSTTHEMSGTVNRFQDHFGFIDLLDRILREPSFTDGQFFPEKAYTAKLVLTNPLRNVWTTCGAVTFQLRGRVVV